MAQPRRDDGSDAESEEALGWLLGFFEPPRNATDLLRHRFPSKVGGRPAWLDPLHLPPREQLTCGATGRPLQFLVQVYAPVEGVPKAFHRTVYVFISPDGSKLTRPGAVRALRCQLPRRNQFYAHEPASREDVWPPPLPPDQHVIALSQDPWRSAAHEHAGQSLEAPSGSSRAAAASEAAAADRHHAGPALLPEAELVVECEPSALSEDDDAAVQALLRQYKQRTAEQGEYDDEELPSEVVDTLEERVLPEQRHFAAFAARVAKDPDQVLRYCFDEAAAPLCPSAVGVPAASDVPPCPSCGAPRWFEFQVMPQLINHLGADAADPSAPDWGTIAVYCCSASCGLGTARGGDAMEVDGGQACSSSSSAYREEYVWVQPSS